MLRTNPVAYEAPATVWRGLCFHRSRRIQNPPSKRRILLWKISQRCTLHLGVNLFRLQCRNHAQPVLANERTQIRSDLVPGLSVDTLGAFRVEIAVTWSESDLDRSG